MAQGTTRKGGEPGVLACLHTLQAEREASSDVEELVMNGAPGRSSEIKETASAPSDPSTENIDPDRTK